MIKKIATLAAITIIVSALFSACDEIPFSDPNNELGNKDQGAGITDSDSAQDEDNPVSIPIEDIDGKELQDTTNDEEDYYYNPRITVAYKVNETTVRVKFTMKVCSPSFNLERFIYAASSIFNDTKVKATELIVLDPAVVGDKNPAVYGMIFDVKFESAVPEDGYICFVEDIENSDRDGALETVLCDNMSTGIYAQFRPVSENEAPVAAYKYGSDVIEAPKTPTVLLSAYLANHDYNAIVFKFSKPVTFIDGAPGVDRFDMASSIYISDQANPTPGKNGSWQIPASSEPQPLDPRLGKDGLLYSATWELTFLGTIPDEGVFRICENGTYADSNNMGEEDDLTLGRIVIAMDGTPLLASSPGTWDVAHCWYSADPEAKIEGSMYDPSYFQ